MQRKETGSRASLWPSTQLIITADTSAAVDGLLHPKWQLKFLGEISAFAGMDIFGDSLVYSTPRGNTGWTAFKVGTGGHVSYHHWDVAQPNLLQLDLFGIGVIDDKHALEVLKEFWVPLGVRATKLSRLPPDQDLVISNLQDDVLRRHPVVDGLGPGDHLELLVDQIGDHEGDLSADFIDAQLMNLVELLNMRAMTPVISRERLDSYEYAYDAIVGITTSHVALRLRKTGSRLEISIDMFSCRNFQADTAFRWLDSMFTIPTCRRAILHNRHPGFTFERVE